MRHLQFMEASAAGEILMHGCSLDNLAAILADDVLRRGLRGQAGPQGVSLTTSIEIARQFCRTHEDEFNEILHSHYGVGDDWSERFRSGVVLVFARDALADLEMVPFRDIDSYDEHEERVLGDVGNVLERLSCIAVDPADIEWFESVVDDVFRAMGEPADEMLAALARGTAKFVAHEDVEAAVRRPCAAG